MRKLVSILAAILVSTFAAASTARAGALPVSGAAFHALTNAQQACLQYNNQGWVWFNWSSSGACNLSTIQVSASIDHITCGSGITDQQVYVDGNCGSTVNCTVRLINYTDGSTVKTATGSGSGNFDIHLLPNPSASGTFSCSDVGTWDYEVVTCSLPPGCKVWGAGASY